MYPLTKIIKTISLIALTLGCFGFCRQARAVDPLLDGSHEKDDRANGIIIQSFPVGPAPWGMAFDDANIWVTSVNSDTITKLRASDGTLLGTFPAGGQTIFAAFD